MKYTIAQFLVDGHGEHFNTFGLFDTLDEAFTAMQAAMMSWQRDYDPEGTSVHEVNFESHMASVDDVATFRVMALNPVESLGSFKASWEVAMNTNDQM